MTEGKIRGNYVLKDPDEWKSEETAEMTVVNSMASASTPAPVPASSGYVFEHACVLTYRGMCPYAELHVSSRLNVFCCIATDDKGCPTLVYDSDEEEWVEVVTTSKVRVTHHVH